MYERRHKQSRRQPFVGDQSQHQGGCRHYSQSPQIPKRVVVPRVSGFGPQRFGALSDFATRRG